MNLIEDRIDHGSQSWTRQTTVSIDGHKVLALIKRDSYAKQSVIKVSVFSTASLEWNSLQYREGVTYKHLISASASDDAAIREDSQFLIDSLLAYAASILEGVKA